MSFRIHSAPAGPFIPEPPFDDRDLFTFSGGQLRNGDRLVIDWTEVEDTETSREPDAWRGHSVTERELTIDSARVTRDGRTVPIHAVDLSELMDLWHWHRERV